MIKYIKVNNYFERKNPHNIAMPEDVCEEDIFTRLIIKM